MSVAYTEHQVRDRIKNVTRRAGWWVDKRGRRLVKPGDRLTLCRKVMGRKKGEPLERITEVEVVDVRREPLDKMLNQPEYGAAEVIAEGFPDLSPAEFIDRYFVEAQGMRRTAWVTRIEWRYLDEETPDAVHQ